MSEKNIFERIIEGEIPADKVFEDDEFCAFRDIHPAAPVHVLVVPKRVIPKVTDATDKDVNTLGGLLLAANKIVRQLGIDDTGCRYIINCGEDGGQEVPHLHLHILGGRRLSWPPG
jgi:histidine triad (HIT) family protein